MIIIQKYYLNDHCEYITVPGDTNAWACFDFKSMEVEIFHYSIMRGFSCNMKNCFFEISDDWKNLGTIDQHSNYEELERISKNSIKTFDVQPSRFVRYCRILHTGQF